MISCENHKERMATWTARDKDGKVHEFCGYCFKEWAMDQCRSYARLLELSRRVTRRYNLT